MRLRTANIAMLVVAALLVVAPDASGATFTVTNTADGGAGSLREAIGLANLDATDDTIDFNIPGAGPHLIQPNSELPAISQPVIIDGTSQPTYAGSPEIVIDGTNAGNSVGFRVNAKVEIKGLTIGNFDGYGILLNPGSDGSLVTGNFIGTDPSGNAAAPNDNGIGIFGPNNIVGGPGAGEGNVISGNAESGVIVVNQSASGNAVLGNLIGVGADGVTDVGNGDRGVFVQNASQAKIGDPLAGNVISGNGREGIRIAGDLATGTVIQANKVGTDATGAAALPNVDDGILLVSPTVEVKMTVGGEAANAGNLISGNNKDGIDAGDNIDLEIRNNIIGTNGAGTAAVPNLGNGILTASSAEIRGNLISGNSLNGINLTQDAKTAVVKENKIGTDATGTAAVPNMINGVYHHGPVITTTSAQIGALGEGNVISGNVAAGVEITGIKGATVEGNLIGTNAAGDGAIANDRGLDIATSDSTFNQNVISGNSGHGAVLRLGASNNLLWGNNIGVGPDGSTAVPNGGNGLLLQDQAASNRIGGATGFGNTISANGGDGVTLVGSVEDNAITGNSIDGNAGLGIDLAGDGVTENDNPLANDNDGGPNKRQNFPDLDLAASHAGTTFVAGSLQSSANDTFQIDFFSSPVADASGNGEGASFLGAIEVTTDTSGDAEFQAVLPVGAQVGAAVSATASRMANDEPVETSEFSDVVTVPACEITGTSGDDVLDGTNNDDLICAGDGNDVINSSEGNDLILGGDGVDTISHSMVPGGIEVDLGASSVADDGFGNSDTLVSVENVIGSEFADQIVGDDGPNILEGLGGKDDLDGGDGDDKIKGGNGADKAKGGDGKDVIAGGKGNDRLKGQKGKDRLKGNKGNDLLNGGKGNDTCNGGPGSNQLVSC